MISKILRLKYMCKLKTHLSYQTYLLVSIEKFHTILKILNDIMKWCDMRIGIPLWYWDVAQCRRFHCFHLYIIIHHYYYYIFNLFQINLNFYDINSAPKRNKHLNVQFNLIHSLTHSYRIHTSPKMKRKIQKYMHTAFIPPYNTPNWSKHSCPLHSDYSIFFWNLSNFLCPLYS